VEKKPDSVFFAFFLPARAKKASVMLLPASAAATLVLVAMQKRWLTRRSGTPLTLYGPVTSRRPLSNCFKKTTRRPRKRPAKRMSTVPGEMLLRNFVGFRELFTLRAFTLFLPKVLNVPLACPLRAMAKMLFVVSVLLAGTSMAADTKVTPVQKVIQLLQNMVDKGTKEKQDEQVQFASFKGFCDNTVSQKQAAIAEATEMIEVLTADIEKYEAEAAELSKAISAHDADISTWEGDIKAAEKVREIEHVDYVATHKDYSQSINALQGAIDVIKKASGKTPQAAAALMQGKRFPRPP